MFDDKLYIEFKSAGPLISVTGNALPTGIIINLNEDDIDKILYPTPEKFSPSRDLLPFYQYQAIDRLVMSFILSKIAKQIPLDLLTEDTVLSIDGVCYNDFKYIWIEDIIKKLSARIIFDTRSQTITLYEEIGGGTVTEDHFNLPPHAIYGFVQKINEYDLAKHLLTIINKDIMENDPCWFRCSCKYNSEDCGENNEGIIALAKKISEFYTEQWEQLPGDKEDEDVDEDDES